MKITEVLSAEIAEITERDCIDYIFQLVIKRTFDGYQNEIKTVYGQLETALGCKIHPAPDEWDRGYNVDFFIKVAKKYVGIQIKPASDVSHITQIFKERELQAKTYMRFREKYGGSVFYVISITEKQSKRIMNPEVIEEIRAEIARLQKHE